MFGIANPNIDTSVNIDERTNLAFVFGKNV